LFLRKEIREVESQLPASVNDEVDTAPSVEEPTDFLQVLAAEKEVEVSSPNKKARRTR
jgi:hypothetical protein